MMKKTILAATLAVVASTTMAQDVKLTSDRMTPEVLLTMGRVGSKTASNNGSIVAYTVSYPNIQKNKSRSVIYALNTKTQQRVALTPEDKSDVEPSFTPDGRIAFLTGGQLWSMNADGSDRKQLLQNDDIEGYRFSPDGSKVVVIRQVDYTGSIDAQEKDLPLSTGMVINDLNFRHWDQFVRSIPHLFLVDMATQQSRDILEGEPYEAPVLPFGGSEQFCWSPDSKSVAYTSRKKTGVQYATSTDTDIYLYDIATGTTRNMCKSADFKTIDGDPLKSLQNQPINSQTTDQNVGYDQDPQFSPDGTMLAWKSMERDGYESDRTRLCVLDMKTGQKIYVTESFESGVDEFCWSADGKKLFFLGVWMGRTMVYQTNLKGDVKALTTGDYDYAGLQALADGKTLMVSRHSMSAPDDIYLLDMGKKGTSVRQITQENKHILDQLALGQVKERWVATTDGKKELCWVIYPSHFDPNKKYPTLLFCEGGPQSPVSQFWSYRWNFQIMAANDYIIIAPNRRGLPGFGMEWLEEISGDYTGQCMQDYLSAIDDIAQEPYVDRDRLGCIGASFGGFSVYWLAGNHDRRFKCFISHDGIFNTQQQYYETEEMWFANWDLGGAPTMFPNNKAFAQSPHLYVDRWDAPILCIHGQKDYRILDSQGQSAFSAARLHGIPAQLLLYPDENHWVLKPQNAVLWQRTFFRWLDRWLK